MALSEKPWFLKIIIILNQPSPDYEGRHFTPNAWQDIIFNTWFSEHFFGSLLKGNPGR